MKFRYLALMFMLVFILGSIVFSQGRSGGRGGGTGGGRPSGVGQPMGNPGMDRGMGNASARSNGRSDTGADRATLARNNANRVSDNELNRFRGVSKKIGSTPEQMRAAYQAALLANPNLTFGQFVAANVVADNLHSRFPAITSSAILAGLANGDSLGRTLQNLGLSHDQAKTAERTAEDEIKTAKQRNKQ